jgi:F0F1-type ATP synthase assembly protein I
MTDQPDKTNRALRIKNLALAGMAGQVGCLTLVIVLGAVFLGLWLDSILGTRPWFTLGLVVVSIPVSLITMLVVARTAISKIKASAEKER